jgi:hypothetical protein
MAASTLALVLRYAFTSPFADDWHWVPVICGSQPLDAAWLWQAENQHRVPLGKLVYLGIGWLSGFDFRANAIASVVLLALISLLLLWMVRRVRGRSSAIDVLIPLLLMHWGQAINLVWGFQLYYVLATVLGGVVLSIIVASRGSISLGTALATTALLAAMAACGGPGVCYVPAIALWIGYGAWLRWHDGRAHARRDAAILLALAVAAIALALAHGAGRPPVDEFATTPAQAEPLVGAIQFLSISVGRFGRTLWPVSGVIILALVFTALGRLAGVAWRMPQERARAAGLALFLAAIATTALATGLARSQLGPKYCMNERYMTLAAPLVIGLYFVGVCYGPAVHGRWLRLGLAVAIVAVALGYNLNGLHHAREYRAKIDRLEGLVQDGFSPRAVAGRCHVDMQIAESPLQSRLELLRAARLGPYRRGLPAPVEQHDALVVPLVRPVANDAIPIRTLVAANDVLEQPLLPSRAERLARIDIRFRDDMRSQPPVATFLWSIDQIGPSTTRRTLRQGRCRPEDLRDPLYVTLTMEPVAAPPGARLRLVLHADPEGAGDKPLRLPRYESVDGEKRENLAGFLYFLLP